MIKFTSQISTTIEQSQQLIEAGLNPQTADMVYRNQIIDGKNLTILSPINKMPPLPQDIPAWSLHRLIEIIIMMYDAHDDTYCVTWGDDVFDKIIYDIKWHIKYKSNDINQELISK
ncbi:MAG: hypothetical protein IKV19_04475 [Bacteroidaceae bacterium]|nr:hypothetical protein [Bacteroidaceae bacterium]